jgi:hypothetical protein
MLFAGLILSAAFMSASPSHINATQEACHLLSKIYPDSTFFPGTTRYEYENTGKLVSHARTHYLRNISFQSHGQQLRGSALPASSVPLIPT